MTELQEIFGPDGVVVEEKRCARYGIDQVGDRSYARTPVAVVFQREAEQVAALMRWANVTGIPVTPRGDGSGLAGAVIPVEGGVVCSFQKMDRVIEIDPDNPMVVVEPGVVTSRLDEKLKPHGLFFAGYPMSEDICFVGGNVAENAGGGRAVKYGTTASYILGAEVVTPTGEILRLGGKRLKDVTGYNLLHLLIGSEGTLGLFTRLTIRVIPRPGARGVLYTAFPDSRRASSCVSELKRSRALSSVEFIDGETARRTNEILPGPQRTDLPESAVVVGGTDEATIDNAWKLRKAVPWWTKRVAGDGNFHITPMKPDSMSGEAWVPMIDRLLRELYTRVNELGGTISGEHGIGRKRTKYLSLALSEEELATMRAIKRTLDPANVLNPGVALDSV